MALVTAIDVLGRIDFEQKSAGSNLYFIRCFFFAFEKQIRRGLNGKRGSH